MYITEKTVTLLRTIAIIVSLAVTLWSLGLPILHFVDAASLTNVSDTLSDSAPSAGADHTISFTTPTGVVETETIVVSMPAGFDLSQLNATDVDIATTSDFSVAANCLGSEEVSFGISGQDLTFTFCAGDGGSIPAGATTTIQIGLNASGGANQIANPAAEGSYQINLTVGSQDAGHARVVILDNVEITAAVETIFTFTVAGVGAGQSVNGDTTTGATGSTSVAFGALVDGVATTTAQDISVQTNAANGYSVTVQIDQPLQSSTGADIDGFEDGSYSDTPVLWDAPSATIGAENTYGHWGITSEDATTTRSAGDEFGVNEWASASTSPRVVMSHDGPADGSEPGVGATRVGYKVQISGLQEAGNDYSTTLTYVATPVF